MLFPRSIENRCACLLCGIWNGRARPARGRTDAAVEGEPPVSLQQAAGDQGRPRQRVALGRATAEASKRQSTCSPLGSLSLPLRASLVWARTPPPLSECALLQAGSQRIQVMFRYPHRLLSSKRKRCEATARQGVARSGAVLLLAIITVLVSGDSSDAGKVCSHLPVVGAG